MPLSVVPFLDVVVVPFLDVKVVPFLECRSLAVASFCPVTLGVARSLSPLLRLLGGEALSYGDFL